MSIRVLHTGDIHLGDLNGPTKDGRNLRRDDTLRCMDEIVQQARSTGPNLTIIAGDLFNRSRVWADTALEDVNDAVSRFIRPLCEYSDAVVLLFGTMNHDNPWAFEVIRETTRDLRNLYIFTTPEVKCISTSGGEVQIVAVPGFDKGRLRLFCPGADKEEENRNATALVNEIILGLSAAIRKDTPSVLTAHYTVSGSEADNGSTFLAGQDVVILPATIDATGVSLACFGHIHKHQRLVSTVPAYYCGSPNQLTFNDEDMEHGCYIHEIHQDNTVESRFISTPERRHFTFRMTQDDVMQFISNGCLDYAVPGLDQAIVRVRYSCTAEQDKAFNRAELQKKLLDAGAFHVSEIIPEDIEELDARDQLTEKDGPAECLAHWLDMNEIYGAKATRLMELAAPIIKRADDGRDVNEHIGAFAPRMIEVKNYRSYAEAAFDFTPVQMAMVNGRNGVGKSSLFMDALADCLFEQSRHEDVGGWVRDGTKSGSITFTFDMGGQTYRVIRTRTKSGRGTLALQRFDGETQVWQDESDTTMKLTQAKIEKLLGMDCNTFCSIALIRQDAYGLFLEADSDRRMEVLSALLGLDIYTRMEEIAKAGATDQRRKIAATKERINILGDQTRQKDGLIAQDADLSALSKKTDDRISVTEAALTAAESAEALRREIVRQHSDKLAQVSEYDMEMVKRMRTHKELSDKLTSAKLTAYGLETAQMAASIIQGARADIERITDEINQDRSLATALDVTESTIRQLEQQEITLIAARSRTAAMLDQKPLVDEAVAKLEEIRQARASAENRLHESLKAKQAVQAAQAALDAHVLQSGADIAALRNTISQLKAEASRITDSGCTAPDGASCKFLASARLAVKRIPALEAELLDLERSAGEIRERLQDQVTEAIGAAEPFGDPTLEIAQLSREEKKYAPTAAIAPQMAAAAAKLESISTELDKISGEKASTQRRRQEITQQRETLAPFVNLWKKCQQAIIDNKRAAETLNSCLVAQASIEALEPQIAKAAEDVEYFQKRKDAAAQEAREIAARIPASTTDATLLRNSLDILRQEATSIATERGQIAAKMQGIQDAERQISLLRREVDQIAEALQDYTTLVQAFGLDGIQYMIIRGVVPEIMRRSNEILASMTGGRMAVDIRTEREQKSTKQIVNSLEVWINTITGGTRPYLSHSGGEKVRISLAVTLGLADVKAHRTGVQLGMLWIDEPPFLDAEGTEAYADALVSMAQRNPNMRILAISHDPAMKGRFAQNIIVSGGENGSTVRME